MARDGGERVSERDTQRERERRVCWREEGEEDGGDRTLIGLLVSLACGVGTLRD